MLTFTELYNQLLEDSVKTGELPTILPPYDSLHLDCLLNPQNYPLVWKFEKCDCSNGEQPNCVKSCLYEAIVPDENGGFKIDMDLCIGCSECINACHAKNLMASRDVLPTLNAVRNSSGAVYALIAPAFLGQFQEGVTAGKLRNSFKRLGFNGMLEVALFADILTLKEALEFDKNIVTESDFQLTSCCCPLWIGMIKKIYKELMPHVPGSVSPMIACGRAIKQLYPDALTIFIGPCIAKKAESRESDLAGAVDFVLTFQEMQDIFAFANIDPSKQPESESEHSSRSGRIYAYSGGVSEAVKNTLERLNPNREISFRSQAANGVASCKEMISELKTGNMKANFYEGMGCVGGCVGGPKVSISPELGRKHVEKYGNDAHYNTPIDNPHVIEILKRLGFETVEDFLENSEIFTRQF